MAAAFNSTSAFLASSEALTLVLSAMDFCSTASETSFSAYSLDISAEAYFISDFSTSLSADPFFFVEEGDIASARFFSALARV